MKFAFEVVDTVRKEEPDLFDDRMEQDIHNMLEEAIECEVQFAEDLLSGGVVGMNSQDMRTYLEFITDQRLIMLGMEPKYFSQNPFPFMELQDVQELANFFERRVSDYSLVTKSNDEEELRGYVEQLLGDEELRTKLGNAARETILNDFSEKMFIDSWNNIFDAAYGV